MPPEKQLIVDPSDKTCFATIGEDYYVEVKGYMDDKSKTKLKRMRIYYPNVEVQLIDSDRYKSIARGRALIKNWE
jgi:hypothetical protein